MCLIEKRKRIKDQNQYSIIQEILDDSKQQINKTVKASLISSRYSNFDNVKKIPIRKSNPFKKSSLNETVSIIDQTLSRESEK